MKEISKEALKATVFCFVGSLCMVAIFSLLFAFVMQALWNEFCGCLHLMPMGYWQMYCFIIFVCAISMIAKND